MNPQFAAGLQQINFQNAKFTDFAPILAGLDSGVMPFSATYVRPHHIGLDAGTVLGPIALRIDAAYETQRVFYQRDLTSFISPAFQVVASFEYQTGDADRVLIVEGTYLAMIDTPPTPLLIYTRDTHGAAAEFRWPIVKPVDVDLRALFGVHPTTYVAQPELTLKLGSCVASLGALILGGDDGSLGGYFARNNEVYAKLKVSL